MTARRQPALKALVLVLVLAVLFEAAAAASTKPASTTKSTARRNKNSTNKNASKNKNSSSNKKKSSLSSSSSRSSRTSRTASLSTTNTRGTCVRNDAFCAEADSGTTSSFFTCGNTQVRSTWELTAKNYCSAASIPCRLTPGVPASCGGLTGVLITSPGSVFNPAADIEGAVISPIDTTVLVKGGNGFCTYPVGYEGPLSTPKNCGTNLNQCGLSHVDLCLCKATDFKFVYVKSGDSVSFDDTAVTDVTDIDQTKCAELESKKLAAVDNCGSLIDIIMAWDDSTDAVYTSQTAKKVDVTELPTDVACGSFVKTYTATHPTLGTTISIMDHTINLYDRFMVETGADKHPICSGYFECSRGTSVVPSGVALTQATCSVEATFSPGGLCGVTPSSVTAVLDGCAVSELTAEV
jgi:hypothetical protein